MANEEDLSFSATLANLSQRLGRIEAHLGIQAAPPPSTEAPSAPITTAPAQPRFAVPEVRGVTAGKPRPSSGTGNLLGAIAVVCFILAGVFLVKLAIDSGWLTPERQIGLAALFGFSLIGGGFLLRSRDEDYAGLLPASGIVILYLSAYGAKLIYGLIGLDVAALSAGAITGLGLWLFARFRHDFFAIACAVGSYAFPLLMSEYRGDYGLIATYLLFWSFAFSVISVFIQTRALPLVSGYLGLGLGALFGLTTQDSTVLPVAVTVQLVQFGFFAAGVTWYSVRNRAPLTTSEAGSYFPLLVFFYATEYALLSKYSPELAPWISLGTAALLLVLYRVARRFLPTGELHSRQLVEGFAAIVLFHSGYLTLLPDAAKPLLFLALVFAIPLFARGRTPRLDRHPVTIPLLLLVFGIGYGRILVGTATPSTELAVLYGLGATAGILWVFLSLAQQNRRVEDLGYAILSFAHLQAIVALYRLATHQGSIAVSVAWGGYAALILGLSFLKRDQVLGRSSVVVLLFAAGKALLYDTSSATPVVRILCLGMTGALLFLGGFLFRRMSTWRVA